MFTKALKRAAVAVTAIVFASVLLLDAAASDPDRRDILPIAHMFADAVGKLTGPNVR